MRPRIWLAGFGLAISAASGCSSSSTVSTAGVADCEQQIRAAGVVYTSYGYSQQAAVRHGVADRAECHDVGADAVGLVFPEYAQQVTTWTFAGYPAERVLGVRFDKGSYAVFVADSIPKGQSERILRDLADRHK